MKRFRWYDWVFGVLTLILLVILIQHSLTTGGENAGFGLWPVVLLLGLPAIILMVVDFQLIRRRRRG